MAQIVNPLTEIGAPAPFDLSQPGGAAQTRAYREPIRELRGLEGVKVYRKMAWNDPVIAATLRAIDMVIRAAAWSVTGGEGEDDPRVVFADECMSDMAHSWNDHISESLSFLPYGWAWFEVVYKKRNGMPKTIRAAAPGSQFNDGRLGWHKFALRPQDTADPYDPWIYEDDALAGFRQSVSGRYAMGGRPEIPIEKSILYRTTTANGPEGLSVLRPAYISHYYATNLAQIEAIGLERNLVGMPCIGEDPDNPGQAVDLSNPTSEGYQAAEKLLRNVRNDEAAGVIVPPGYKFWLAGIAGTVDVSKSIRATIEAHEAKIAISLLAGFLFLGFSTSTGSYALSQTMQNLFYDAVSAWITIIKDTLNRHVLPKLFLLNGMSLENMPTLAHEPVKVPDVAAIADSLSKLATAGLLGSDVGMERWLRGLYDAPELTDDVIAERGELRREIEEARQRLTDLAGGGEAPDADEMSMWADYYRLTPAAIDRKKNEIERRYTRRLEAYYARQRAQIAEAVRAAQ